MLGLQLWRMMRVAWEGSLQSFTSYGVHERSLQVAEHGLGETARDLNFLTDHSISLQYGLVEIGGFRRYGELTPEQSRALYVQETANMTS